MPLSRRQFIERLSASGVMSAAAVGDFETALPAGQSPADAQALARELVRAGKLTKYQAAAIYQGKTKGLVLGNYVILDKIGAGGMGQVFKALHRRMDRVVALKVLPDEAMKLPDAIQRFHREVKAAARLEHPNIVTAYDADEADGVHFLVMQYVEGSDLSELLKKSGPLAVPQAVECIRQAAVGLAYAHAHGVIHRDIKPANLLLSVSGQRSAISQSGLADGRPLTADRFSIKILDMGLARLEDQIAAASEAHGLTQSGQIMGTVDYMSPEQAEETRGVDARADQYSLGCTLWVLLTGRPMYGGTTTIAKLLAHRTAPAPSLRAARADVPEALEAVYQRMVAKEPDERYALMDEVVAALAVCLGEAAPAQLDGPSSSDSKLSEFFRQIGGTKTGAPPVSITAVDAETQPFQPGKVETGTEQSIKGAGRGARGEELKTSIGPLAQSVAAPASPAPRPSPRTPRKLHPLLLAAGLAVAGIGSVGALLALLLWLVLPDGEPNSATHPVAPPVATAATNTPPPLAVAPFDGATAKKHQKAWADYLGLPVEREIDLPGGVKLTMVLIPPGEFLMGSTDEERAKFLAVAIAANDPGAANWLARESPQHRVRITKPFYLGKYEVTQAQWQSVMGNNPSQYKDNPTHPVEQVSWDDVQAFLAKLNSSRPTARMQFVLPSEAQWEYGCRAGTTTYWHSGESEDELRTFCWFDAHGGNMTHPVGKLGSNRFGLHDMHGNVWEWCADRRGADYYATSPVNDPSGPSTGVPRLLRGGGWKFRAGNCRSARRSHDFPSNRTDRYGFRLAVTIDVAAAATNPPPPLAVAPFDLATAKKHQKAWAEYLGLPVEREIDLPGGAKLTMMLIPPGEFLMGSTDEERAQYLKTAQAAQDEWSVLRIPGEGPQHRVRITRPFYLGKHEVTQAQWRAVMGNEPAKFNGKPDHPVEQVSWNEVGKLLEKLNAEPIATGIGFALPTEAQWEYACRAGTTTSWHVGENPAGLGEYAWLTANSAEQTHPVGRLEPNSFGLYDMHGNVWEWCADWFDPLYYDRSPVDDPRGPSAGEKRVRRGGSWYHHHGHCRSAIRIIDAPDYRRDFLGFRLAANIDLPRSSPVDIVAHDRAVAEWVLSVGGEVEVFLSADDTPTLRIDAIEDLPAGDFKLRHVWLHKANGVSADTVTDEDFRRLSGLTRLLGLTVVDLDCSGELLKNLKDVPLSWIELEHLQVNDAHLAELKRFPNVFFLSLNGTQVTAAGLGALRELPKLIHLHLAGLALTDDDVPRLLALPNLNTLNVSETRITGAGVRRLVQMPQLTWFVAAGLELQNADVAALGEMTQLTTLKINNNPALTDEGLAHLGSLTRLTLLALEGTAVTQQGVESLRQKLPDCKIVTDFGAFEPANAEFALRLMANDRFELPVSVGGTGPFTLEAVVTPDSVAPNAGLLNIGRSVSIKSALRGATWQTTMHREEQAGGYLSGIGDSIKIGQPVHLAVVRDGARLQLFVDGAPANPATAFSDPEFTVESDLPEGPLVVGYRDGFAGLIHAVRVSDIARYDQAFAPLRRFERDDDTLALYHFDEGAGEMLRDSSGDGHDGKIVGAKWVKFGEEESDK